MVLSSCNDLTNSTKEIKFVKVGTIVIFRLQHYVIFRGNPSKDNRTIKCSSDPLKIPVFGGNSVSFSASFFVQGTINHSGTLQAGHYLFSKRDKHANK